MLSKNFYKICKENFGRILTPFGFDSSQSRRATFYRKVHEEVYHLITPCLGRGGTGYTVYVFPTSPILNIKFFEKFPDELSFPGDSTLSEHDVGSYNDSFYSETKEDFFRIFERRTVPALVNVAVPYLNRFQSVSDMIPIIRHEGSLGLALHHAGRYSEAIRPLESTVKWFKNSADQDLKEYVAYLGRALSECRQKLASGSAQG